MLNRLGRDDYMIESSIEPVFDWMPILKSKPELRMALGKTRSVRHQRTVKWVGRVEGRWNHYLIVLRIPRDLGADFTYVLGNGVP